ncbi:hypothetical protein [Flavobacterium daemonense]|uniref:hypothetical protein n=1 Tax=Flavobacterium daemonense TaxID=1393049 RepID=UPI001185F425|nr:hypothetical protein [Flavobacterium daemonense]KAF2333695.1 hypothetical protein FND99_09485 [Flavobacterium daemonense]
MSNFTIEDYRKAIKAKYEKEINGEYSNNLSSPTTANLRNLCIKRFESNTNKDDLSAFEYFFNFPFDKDKKNLFGEDELNKLESVKRFFLGRTEKPAEDTIQLAAILVDLQPRPFNKFKKLIDQEDLELINELRLTNNSDKEDSSNSLKVQAESEDFNVLKTDYVTEERNSESKKSIKRNKYFEKLFNRSKPTMITTAVIFCLIAATIYFAFIKKHCMQWSEDHFDVVDCNVKTENQNKIIPYDGNLLEFKKIRVCDTTTNYTDIWYSKCDNVVEFFNTHGRNPVNDKPLRAVTKHIFERYAEKCGSKK